MVYVQNTFEQPLMPMADGREVRLLLKTGKAGVVKKVPLVEHPNNMLVEKVS